MEHWNPRPRKPLNINTDMFKMVETETVVKALTPMQVQRAKDGTPHTKIPVSNLRAADPELFLEGVSKGSLVEKIAKDRPLAPKTDPADPLTVVKAFLNMTSPEEEKAKKKTEKSMSSMANSILDFAKKAGIKTST